MANPNAIVDGIPVQQIPRGCTSPTAEAIDLHVDELERGACPTATLYTDRPTTEGIIPPNDTRAPSEPPCSLSQRSTQGNNNWYLRKDRRFIVADVISAMFLVAAITYFMLHVEHFPVEESPLKNATVRNFYLLLLLAVAPPALDVQSTVVLLRWYAKAWNAQAHFNNYHGEKYHKFVTKYGNAAALAIVLLWPDLFVIPGEGVVTVHLYMRACGLLSCVFVLQTLGNCPSEMRAFGWRLCQCCSALVWYVVSLLMSPLVVITLPIHCLLLLSTLLSNCCSASPTPTSNGRKSNPASVDPQGFVIET